MCSRQLFRTGTGSRNISFLNLLIAIKFISHFIVSFSINFEILAILDSNIANGSGLIFGEIKNISEESLLIIQIMQISTIRCLVTNKGCDSKMILIFMSDHCA